MFCAHCGTHRGTPRGVRRRILAQRLLFFALIAGSLTAALPAQSPPAEGVMDRVTRKSILAIEEELSGAIGRSDTAALGRLLAPNFVVTRVVEGSPLQEGGLKDFLSVRQRVGSFSILQSRVRYYGSVATAVLHVRMKSVEPDNSERSGDFFIADTFVSTSDGSWKLAQRCSGRAETK